MPKKIKVNTEIYCNQIHINEKLFYFYFKRNNCPYDDLAKKKNDFQIVIIEIFKMIKICLRQTLHGSRMTVLFKESQTKGNKSFITLETYSEPCQTFKTKFFAKISNCLQLNPFQFGWCLVMVLSIVKESIIKYKEPQIFKKMQIKYLRFKFD